MMASQNDSVIICDSSSPSSNQCARSAMSFRKRVRSCDEAKNLLGTVYESPLVHLRRNTRQQSVDSDVTVVSTPPSKRSKINVIGNEPKETHDQSIIVINDTTGKAIIEVALSDVDTNDVIELPQRRYRTRSSILEEPLLTPLRPTSRRRNKILNEPEVQHGKLSTSRVQSASVNDENCNGQIIGNNFSAPSEAEDIEVLWVSDANTDQLRHSGNASLQQPFVIDTQPSVENLSKKSLRRMKALKRLGSKGPKPQAKESKQKRKEKRRNKRPNIISHSVLSNQALANMKLREIVIDGANVAMGHKPGTGFSEKGLEIVINYFKDRGHAVRAFLPQYMRKADRTLLEKLNTSGHLVFTPSRKIGGKKITPYDDRFILEYATKCDGIVVSSDQYRDLWHEKPQWRDTIEKRLLTPTFVGDYLMFPEDPLGRNGPKLEEFLRH